MMLIMIALLGFIAGLLLVFAWHMNHRAGDRARVAGANVWAVVCPFSKFSVEKCAPLGAGIHLSTCPRKRTFRQTRL